MSFFRKQTATVLPEPRTRYERYPHLNSIEKDEAIYMLQKRYELLEKRVDELEKK